MTALYLVNLSCISLRSSGLDTQDDSCDGNNRPMTKDGLHGLWAWRGTCTGGAASGSSAYGYWMQTAGERWSSIVDTG